VKLAGAALAAMSAPAVGESAEHAALDPDRMGVLVDLTVCVGCRRCEWACCEANGLPHGELHEYDDQSVFAERRYPSAAQLTVVNRAGANPAGREPVHLKVQCMHCDKPACVSACLVGALRKDPKGPVRYDANRCIGCRYCMMACPFGCLGYEYDRKLTPRVRKCELCHERTREGRLPACVETCPVEALTYGRRSELLTIARERIAAHPERYADHIYGEHEAGGTSWLYIADRPFAELGFPRVANRSQAEVTEAIQHGIF
jgi:Fe-S-cluster-containing dehydrogenase component